MDFNYPTINYPVQDGNPRVDFHKGPFDTVLQEKGRRVLLERSLICPCKSESLNQQGSCRNCGGTGFVFINPVNTRMVIQSMNKSIEYKPWSLESPGMVNISALEQDELSYMDRITVLDARSIYNEVLHFKYSGSSLYAYTAYPIKEVKYCGLFTSTSTAFQRLVQGTDFTVVNDSVILDGSFYNPMAIDPVAVTIKYIHAPTYNILELKRESMETFEISVGEKLIRLPLSAIGKRAHYNMTKENLLGNRLLDNSYSTDCEVKTDSDNCGELQP